MKKPLGVLLALVCCILLAGCVTPPGAAFGHGPVLPSVHRLPVPSVPVPIP